MPEANNRSDIVGQTFYDALSVHHLKRANAFPGSVYLLLEMLDDELFGFRGREGEERCECTSLQA